MGYRFSHIEFFNRYINNIIGGLIEFLKKVKKNEKKCLTNNLHCDIISMLNFWVWRRLVARYLGVVEAAGSNPVTQTIKTA